MKIVTILGARPQFIIAWAVSAAFRQAGLDEVVVHTGQHYDESLSGRFFTELQLRQPDHHLGVARVGALLGMLAQLDRPAILSLHPRAQGRARRELRPFVRRHGHRRKALAAARAVRPYMRP